MFNFPNDADGDTLRNLQSQGVDLSKPRQIEFYCYAKDRSIAERICQRLDSLGYSASVYCDEERVSEGTRFSVYAIKFMIPAYDLLIAKKRGRIYFLLICFFKKLFVKMDI